MLMKSFINSTRAVTEQVQCTIFVVFLLLLISPWRIPYILVWYVSTQQIFACWGGFLCDSPPPPLPSPPQVLFLAFRGDIPIGSFDRPAVLSPLWSALHASLPVLCFCSSCLPCRLFFCSVFFVDQPLSRWSKYLVSISL